MLRNSSRPADTKLVVRVLVGVLLALNLIAGGLLMFPPGGSASDLEQELASLETQVAGKRALLQKTRQHLAAVELGRNEGDQFLSTYFLSSRARSEMLLSELGSAAKDSKIKAKDTSVSMEPIDGSDTLSMMSVVANYEGTYADLLHFVHEIDRSPTLVIIESLNAAPLAGTNLLSISMKLDTFVRDDVVAGGGSLWNLIPDKIGGTRKQYIWLGVLVVVMIGLYFMNREPSVSATAPTAAPSTTAFSKPPSIARQQAVIPETSGPKLATRSGRRVDDFRPTLKLPEGMDVTKIDPTLKTDLLAKLQKVPLEGGSRSVFDWGQAPVPPPPKVAPIKPEVIAQQEKAKAEADAKAAFDKAHPPKPAAPPIPLKFYGYANRLSGPARQAFFLDGDDIQIKGENDVIRGKYKIIRIGINSAVVEDLQNHDQQTLPLVAELNS